MNGWELLYRQSRANECYYKEDELPQQNWEWPTHTWFQARLEQVRDQESTVCAKLLRRRTRTSGLELS